MEVKIEFFLEEDGGKATTQISGFDLQGVGGLGAIPVIGDGVCLDGSGTVYQVQDRIFNWLTPTQVRVEVYVGPRDD
ncbi:hypothetical protein [Comamonas terrigena]|uniref:hypothetical protein n=1 Tax=Comamonas terrigena TaxID=32013 RepID=UPI0028993C10|nr:hypothetical protein [Comamonas terrigena]